MDEQKIEKSVQDLFDLNPRGNGEHLKLLNKYMFQLQLMDISERLSNDGHFSWENYLADIKGITQSI